MAAQANNGSRFTYDGLRSTRLLTHAGGGSGFASTDHRFRTHLEPDCFFQLYEKAQNAQAQASTLDIVLITDQAFYNALEAQAW